MKSFKFPAFVGITLMFGLGVPQWAQAQYPERQITMVVPFGVGGTIGTQAAGDRHASLGATGAAIGPL